MIRAIFTDHPNSVGMTYTSHFKHSLYLSFIMAYSSVKAFVHAIIPSLFVTGTTDAYVLMGKLLNRN